jgi:D-threo-aldose 1-dehydrogenase
MKTRHWDRLGNGGITFTELGFGTAPLGNLYRAISDAEADAILETAWEGGVRYFDTAPLYGLGLSETRLNRFLRDKPRDGYVLSSKVGRLLRVAPEHEGQGKWFDVPSRVGVYDYTHDGVMRSVEFSLERLGVARIDILYVHDLDVWTHGSAEVLEGYMRTFLESGHRALVALRDQGVIRAFGAGINEEGPAEHIARHGDPDLFLLASRYTLLQQPALESFLPYCESRGIGVVIGAPYNSGILATGARPGAKYSYEDAPEEVLERVRRIEVVCARHGVRLVDAAFRFPLRHPAVVSVIPGGQGVAEMVSNLAAERAEVPDALWADLKAEGLLRTDAPV